MQLGWPWSLRVKTTRAFTFVHVTTTSFYFPPCSHCEFAYMLHGYTIRSSTLSKEGDEKLIHGNKFICSSGTIINAQITQPNNTCTTQQILLTLRKQRCLRASLEPSRVAIVMSHLQNNNHNFRQLTIKRQNTTQKNIAAGTLFNTSGFRVAMSVVNKAVFSL